MFNRNEPYNNLPKLPPSFNFDDIEILKLTNKANIALSELNGSSRVLPNGGLVLEPFTVREAVASSGIENINTTVSEVFQADLLLKYNTNSITSAQKETLNYRNALLKGFSLVEDKGFLNTNSFVEIQGVLEPNKKGIRNLPGTKIQNDFTKEIKYTPPEGETLIRDLLKNYENFYNDLGDEYDPLIKMAILHYQFEAIHPFFDGNGRTGRILMVLYLVLCKRLDFPILFISGYINKNKSDYYQLLSNLTEKNDWKPWIIYILKGVIEQSNTTVESIQGIKNLMSENKKLLHKFMPKISSPELLDYLFSSPFYDMHSIQNKLEIHRNTASKYFSELVKIGILDIFKDDKTRVYYNPKLLALLER